MCKIAYDYFSGTYSMTIQGYVKKLKELSQEIYSFLRIHENLWNESNERKLWNDRIIPESSNDTIKFITWSMIIKLLVRHRETLKTDVMYTSSDDDNALEKIDHTKILGEGWEIPIIFLSKNLVHE